MKSYLQLTTLFAVTLLSPIVMSVEIVVHPDPVHKNSGPESLTVLPGCPYPYGFLEASVTPDKNDDPSIVNNIHVVIESGGEYYQYVTVGGPYWQPISIKGLMTSPALKASLIPFPGETKNVRRQLPLGKFCVKGTKVYVGVRASDTAGFIDGSLKEAFVVQ